MKLSILISLLVGIESHGNPAAVGDRGKSLGVLQIQRAVVTDVNEHFGTDFRWTDAIDPEKARVICRLYLTRYATKERIGHEPTAGDVARIWNGGPNGFRKHATLAYKEKLECAIYNNHLQQTCSVDSIVDFER